MYTSGTVWDCVYVYAGLCILYLPTYMNWIAAYEWTLESWIIECFNLNEYNRNKNGYNYDIM